MREATLRSSRGLSRQTSDLDNIDLIIGKGGSDDDDEDNEDDDDQGWRKLDPGTGDEAGTTEGAFHLWSSSSSSSSTTSSSSPSSSSSSLP